MSGQQTATITWEYHTVDGLWTAIQWIEHDNGQWQAFTRAPNHVEWARASTMDRSTIHTVLFLIAKLREEQSTRVQPPDAEVVRGQ